MRVSRMLRDVEFFRSRISKLDGAAGLGEYFVKLVERKEVATTTTTAGTARKPDENASAANGQAAPGANAADA